MSTTTSLSVIATTRPTTIWSDSTSDIDCSIISIMSASDCIPSPPPIGLAAFAARSSSSSVTVRPRSLPV